MGQKLKKILRKSILSADIFQQPVQLKIKKSFGHKTYCGAVLTIVLIITISIMAINNLIILINKTNPSTFQSKFQLEGQNIITLNPQNFTMQFSLNNPNFQSFLDETVYSVEAFLTKKYTPIVNGTLEYFYERRSLPLILCSKQIQQQDSMNEYFSKYDLGNNYCLDWSQINEIQLMRSDQGEEQYIELKFKYCIDDIKCKAKDKIIEKLNRNYVSIQFSTYNYDFKDYNKPDYPIGQQVYTSVSSKIFKEVFVDLSIMTIQTDDGVIVSDVNEKKSFKYEKFVEMTNYDESNSIVNCILRINDEEIIHYRSYPRLQALLGEVGGLWSVLFTLGSIILIPIRQLSLQIALINCLFNFETKEKQIAQNDIKSIKKTHLKQTILSSTQKNLKISNLNREISFKIEKDKLDEQIQQLLILFFNTHITKIYISFLGFINHLFFKKYNKDMQLEYSTKKMERSLDIVYIMKKIEEIDKLKLILMSKEQIQMFDYMQRPKIYLDQASIQQKSEEQLYSILRKKQTTKQKSELAQQAFDILVENNHDPINTKLLSFIDPNINQLLTMRSNKQQNTSIK